MTPSQVTTHELWVEGRQMTISLTKTDATTALLSWILPTTTQAYNGVLVLLSEEKFTSANFPVDGTRYVASTNFLAPADTIDHCKVVVASYGFFGDNVTQTSAIVTNLDPNKVYYASIHAASNVLQYFTIGVQSYPLESSRFEKSFDTYAGSIQIASVPPTNPQNGDVYFDPATNFTLVWNDTQSAWMRGSESTTPTGLLLPIAANQLIYNTMDTQLKVFSGGGWVVGTPSNIRIKVGPTWAPANVLGLQASIPNSGSMGDVVHVVNRRIMGAPGSHELFIFTLGGWTPATNDLIQFNDGTTWTNVIVGVEPVVAKDPDVPKIGDFFYQTSDKKLFIWTGTDWVQADKTQEGSPTTDKIGVGTDGSYDERLRLMKILKHQLGYPQLCVELSEEQLNVAIDNALDEFRRRADNAYTNRFVLFTINRGQTTYYLNDPRDKTDKIVQIIKIHRINQLGLSSLSTESSLYAQAFYNQIYNGGSVDIVSVHLMAQLAETYQKIFAGDLMFTWDEASRQLNILRRLQNDRERVILEVAMERTEQELLLDRYAKQWLQAWAESEALEMLGMIRTKYGTLPGPNGGITLNGDTLLNMATEKQAELLRQINDYEVGNGVGNFGNTSFLIG